MWLVGGEGERPTALGLEMLVKTNRTRYTCINHRSQNKKAATRAAEQNSSNSISSKGDHKRTGRPNNRSNKVIAVLSIIIIGNTNTELIKPLT